MKIGSFQNNQKESVWHSQRNHNRLKSNPARRTVIMKQSETNGPKEMKPDIQDKTQYAVKDSKERMLCMLVRT